jgi:hypothetical protein
MSSESPDSTMHSPDGKMTNGRPIADQDFASKQP